MKLFYQLNKNQDGLIVTGGENLKGELNIPSEQNFEGKTYPVTKIGRLRFWGKDLTSIIIPDSVTEIGDEAFSWCTNLTGIVIPDSVTKIGKWAFYACKSLTSIDIPNSVTKIGDYAFAGCTGLTSIVVDKKNEHYDSRENCNAIIESDTNTLVAGCFNTIIPDSVTEIGDGAFKYCRRLTSIDIPNSVTKIGGGSFLGLRVIDLY